MKSEAARMVSGRLARGLGLRWCVAAAVALLMGASPAALAQYQAPAGNAHPETRDVAEAGQALPNPFGPIARPRSIDPKEKQAFAAALNLDALREAAVFHNGRVKVLDTLARETVEKITGRRRYSDASPAFEPVKGERIFKYDPLFTLLDLIIDPGYYADKPLVHVNYLPMRRAILEAEFPGAANEGLVSNWKRVGRVTPLMVQRHAEGVLDKHAFEQPYRDSGNDIRRGLSLWENSAANMMLVAPDRPELPWSHLSTLGAEEPARAAALELGSAWRAGDAARAQRAVDELARILPTINAGNYPRGKLDLEIVYNRANAFEWGLWSYLSSLVALLLAFGTARRWLAWTGGGLLLLAIGLHAFGFVLRCVIAERFAIQNQFESMTGLSLFAAVVGLGIMIARRQWLFGAASAAVGFLVLVTATQTNMPGEVIEREAAILNTSVLLKYHVTTVLVSYGLITLGMVVSVFYLAAYYLGGGGGSGGGLRGAALAGAGGPSMGVGSDVEAVAGTAMYMPTAPTGGALASSGGGGGAGGEVVLVGRQRLLADLDTAQMTVLQLAFWTLGVGILLGAWWADHSWGRWWAFDPKETWALITWIVYLIVIHLRFTQTGPSRALTTAWLSVAGFVIMLWTYFGVNLLLPGLHAYA